jgi:integrase
MAATVLASIPRQGDYVFPARRNLAKEKAPVVYAGWGRDKAKLDDSAQVKDWVLHDLRRTLSTRWASLSIPLEVTEKYVNHISGSTSGVAGIYNRHTYMPEMREAVSRYEQWLHKLLTQA